MKEFFLTAEASQNFISTEVLEFFNNIVFGMPNWKWLALTLSVVLLYFFRKILIWLILKVKKAQSYFLQKTFMQHFLDQEIEKPLSWIAYCVIGFVVIDSIEMIPILDKYLSLSLKLLLSFNVIRSCYLAAEALGSAIRDWTLDTTAEFNNHIAPIATKTAKVSVVVVGFLIVLQNFGVNVTALLAGLGIGGVALAFAAQDTVSNVFGTITILLDTPFKMGDLIKVGDTEGNVIDIGFRSTRIKTLYNSVVTLPNSTVAKEKIDNLSNRNGWIRFHQTMGYTYEATPEQIKNFSDKFQTYLAKNADIDKERILIHVNAYADFSINVLISFHYKVKDTESVIARNGEYLKLIYEFSKEAQLSFAYPTQTLIVQK